MLHYAILLISQQNVQHIFDAVQSGGAITDLGLHPGDEIDQIGGGFLSVKTESAQQRSQHHFGASYHGD
jgi:hypothetical protein